MDKDTIYRDEEMSDLEAQLYYEEWLEEYMKELFEQFLKQPDMLNAWNRHVKFFEDNGVYDEGIRTLFLQDYEEAWNDFVQNRRQSKK